MLYLFCSMSVPDGVIVPMPMPKPIEPMAWLIGTWRCENIGAGKYPTVNDFKYGEELTFAYAGKPMLSFSSFSWHPEKKTPMHQESGFLRIKPGTNEVSLLVAHNFGAK